MTMIAEPGVLSTSSWNTDSLFKDIPCDLMKSYFNGNDGIELGGISTIGLESHRSQNKCSRRQDFSSSCSPSSIRSEYSEELSLDYICKPNDPTYLSDHDYSSTTLNLLDDNSMAFCTEIYDWTTDHFTSPIDDLLTDESIFNENGEQEEFEIPLVPPVPSKPKHCVDPVADNTLWSSMALSEQLTAIEDLTDVISNQLGLREQLDIIRIIEPTARVAPNDTEFVIDLNLLNDQKLLRVRDYMKKVQANQRHQKHVNNKHNGCHHSGSSWKNAQCSTKGRNSKLSKEEKERRAQQKAEQQQEKERLNKKHQQTLKERRSGLFVREEILSFDTQLMTIDEDSDIDILG